MVSNVINSYSSVKISSLVLAGNLFRLAVLSQVGFTYCGTSSQYFYVFWRQFTTGLVEFFSIHLDAPSRVEGNPECLLESYWF